MKELIIVGAGPAGLACSIYASRFKIDHLLIAKTLGGTLTEAHWIQNYPGIQEIRGADLAQKMLSHAQSYGAEIVQDEIVKIQSSNLQLPDSSPASGFRLQTSTGKTYQSQTLFLGLGTRVRHLGVPGEEKFLGKGVAYCAACDAPLYRGKTVAVVGGGNAAVTAALQLAELCPQVYLINRNENLRAEPFWQERLHKTPNTLTLLNTNVTEIIGDEAVRKIKLDRPFQGKNTLPVEGVFIEIGATPAVALTQDLGVELTKSGLIKIAPDGQTSVKGVWAGGDVATACKDLEPRQIVHATSEGAMAALSIFKHLRGQETKV
jgi:thioredoxin reductase (NADPH)